MIRSWIHQKGKRKTAGLLWLSLLLCAGPGGKKIAAGTAPGPHGRAGGETASCSILSVETSAAARERAHVAVFYRTFADPADPETADLRAALDEALEDMGIAYREYDGADDPAIQAAQIAEEEDAMLLIVSPADQDSEEAAEEVIAQVDGRPLIFFDCEISREAAEEAGDMCVLVNAGKPETAGLATDLHTPANENESETADTVSQNSPESGDGSETEAETGIKTETDRRAESESGTESETGRDTKSGTVSETESETENETEKETAAESEVGVSEKNIGGMADVIALIAGNYMTGAGFFEGIEEDWITDEWRVDVP